jgi:hypothetical protein
VANAFFYVTLFNALAALLKTDQTERRNAGEESELSAMSHELLHQT